MRKIKTKEENELFCRKLTKISLSSEVMEVMSLASVIYSISNSCRHLSVDLKNLGASSKDRKEVESLVKKVARKILIIKKIDAISCWDTSAKVACLDFIKEYPLLSGFIDDGD